MKWIGTTMSVATSIIRPARSAPHLKSPAPNAANSRVATIASVHLPTGDQSKSPSSMWAPTVELTTIKSTARQRSSSCECSFRNSPAKLDHEIGGGGAATSTRRGAAADRRPASAWPAGSGDVAGDRCSAAAKLEISHPLRPGLVGRLQAHQSLVRRERLVELPAPLLGKRRSRQRVNVVGSHGEDLLAQCDRLGVAAALQGQPSLGKPSLDVALFASLFGLASLFFGAFDLLRLEPVQLGLKLRKVLGRLGAAGDGVVIVAKVPVESDDQFPGLVARRDPALAHTRPIPEHRADLSWRVSSPG